ncbi:hypothetical protein I302_101872 [Kwoniella bestiolae CBS 10118]|uniref:Uncharacterized protein n=1 Tax=Kwoniella bestiolae CBS 10118 TaxID=1296100 RepID=A0A1B9GDF9_9TREE|nr:hypothetical protein I302_00551 [Kwoniella bestiolae CBS 10118]OCF29060.1 hypothetical protein I302_00551 [Kwoniella bestiolae CBS 10118]
MSFAVIRCRFYTLFGKAGPSDCVIGTKRLMEADDSEKIVLYEMEKRGGTAPDGMVLADWQTYLSYVTTINDTPYTVTTIANLPLTYYGPSIPLGDGWTYGGLESPTGTDNLAPPMTESHTPTTQTEDIPSITSTAQTLQSTASSATSSSLIPSSSTASSSSQTSAIPSTLTLPPSSSHSTTSPSSTAFMPDTLNNPPSDPTQPPNPSPSSADEGRNLLGPLLGALIPLVLAILAILIFFGIYHRNRHSRDSRYFGLFSKSKWSALPSGPSQTGGKGKSREIGEDDPAIGGIKSPNEKSALLPGWTAQHHRRNSQQDLDQVDDELRELARRNESLLQRLNLGMGWLKTTPTPSNSSGSSGGFGSVRKASGNTLEKGGGKRIFSPATLASATAALATSGLGNKRNKRNTNLTVSTEGYERVLEDDQLFFSVPQREDSSNYSRTGSATGSPPISQDPSGSGMRLSPPAEIRGMGSQTFSVGIPITPGTEANDLSMELGDGNRRARWSEDGERIRFPAPPVTGVGLGLYDDGTFGRPPRLSEGNEGVAGRRESYLSAETEYYSAPSHNSSPQAASKSTGIPIPRDTEDYRHVSVSAFGSHPSTPTRPGRFSQHDSSQSHRDLSPVRLVSPIASPSKTPKAQARPTSGIGSTFHSIRNLFSSTPTPSPGVIGVAEGSSKDKRRSYVGQPLVDDRLKKVSRSMGEFGEPLKQGALVAPTIMQPRPSHSSEQASIHLSIPSQHASHSSHSTSGSSSNDATEASHEPVVRGKRSKGMLIRASKIGELSRPQPLPIQVAGGSSQAPGGIREHQTREWEGNIDEFMGEGEELPPLTPGWEGERDKGMRWLGRWSSP